MSVAFWRARRVAGFVVLTSALLLSGAPWKRAGALPGPLRPASIVNAVVDASSSTQQVVLSAPTYGAAAGTLTAYQYSGGLWHVAYGPVRAELGVHSLSDNRTEGDGTTPAGTFQIGPAMYGLGPPLNSRYPYHRLVCGDWWSGEHDATYNQFRSVPCGQNLSSASEALWRQTVAYQHFCGHPIQHEPDGHRSGRRHLPA